MAEEHEFEVVQDGMVVAIVSGGDREQCLREAMHYVAIYSQDGECQVKGITPEDWKRLTGRDI